MKESTKCSFHFKCCSLQSSSSTSLFDVFEALRKLLFKVSKPPEAPEEKSRPKWKLDSLLHLREKSDVQSFCSVS